MEASGPVFGFAMAVATFAAIAGVTAGVRFVRECGLRRRVLAGHALLGGAAALLVFLFQSVNFGASFGGAVLALAFGGIAVLVMALVGNA